MEFSVISFNIRSRDDENGNSIDERAPRLKEILSRYDADIIGIQECTPVWFEYIKKYYETEYEIYNVYRRETNLESTPVLWNKNKFKCIDKGCFWLSDTPEIESGGMG